jgi:hypothetical protein
MREGYPTNKKGSTTAFCHVPQRRKLVPDHEVAFQRSKSLRDPKTQAERTRLNFHSTQARAESADLFKTQTSIRDEFRNDE